jgi:hypothetical protein
VTFRHVLRYDPGLGDVDTWRLLDDGSGIALRLKVGPVECASEIECRWQTRSAAEWPAAVHIQPMDDAGSLWISRSVELGGGILRRELQLEKAPEHAAQVMLTW